MQTDRGRDRNTGRQQADTCRDRYTGRQVQRKVRRQTGVETGTQADKSRDKYTGRQVQSADRCIDRYTGRQQAGGCRDRHSADRQTDRDLPSVPLSHWCPSISWSIMAKKCVLASSVITQPPVTISRRPESISLHTVTPKWPSQTVILWPSQ